MPKAVLGLRFICDTLSSENDMRFIGSPEEKRLDMGRNSRDSKSVASLAPGTPREGVVSLRCPLKPLNEIFEVDEGIADVNRDGTALVLRPPLLFLVPGSRVPAP